MLPPVGRSRNPAVDAHFLSQQVELSRDIEGLLGIAEDTNLEHVCQSKPWGTQCGPCCAYGAFDTGHTSDSLQREKRERERKIFVPAEHPGGEMQPVSFLQEATSLSDLFDRAERSGVNLVSHPAGLMLIRSALRRSDPEQWELHEMGIPCAPSGMILSPGSWDYFTLLPFPDRERPLHWSAPSYLQHYEFEIATCAFITGAILTRCPVAMSLDEKRWSVLVTASTDPHNPRWVLMHRALWRIWTFCRIFGSGKGRECDWDGQRAWLAGDIVDSEIECHSRPGSFHSEVLDNPPASFGLGNRGGLSLEELGDMVFIWRCLQALLRDHLQRGPLPAFLYHPSGSEPSTLVEEIWDDWQIRGIFMDSLLGLGLAAVGYLLSRHDRHPLRVAHDLRWTTDPVIQRGRGDRSFLLYACEVRMAELGGDSSSPPERDLESNDMTSLG